MMIPWQQLSPDALQGLIDAFVEREGTDYGAHEVDADTKYQQILAQVKEGHVVIVYEEYSESINILTRQAYDEHQKLLGGSQEE
jgi:uncharacterized protein YheU (UPF0270 family)